MSDILYVVGTRSSDALYALLIAFFGTIQEFAMRAHQVGNARIEEWKHFLAHVTGGGETC